MRLKVAAIMCVLCLLCGCANSGESVNKALAMRSKLSNSAGCSFHTVVNADYGDKLYKFSMDCKTDQEGNLIFCVTEPETIAGITGKISSSGGAITFDDKVLAFQTIADGQITPVTAPWLLIKTLAGGYINGCTTGDDGYQISIDDSYEEDALRLNIWIQGDVPVSAEIFWQGRRFLTLSVEDFAFL